MIDFYDFEKPFIVDIEVSTLCNASCPCCPRNVEGGFIQEGLPLKTMSLNQFKDNFPLNILQKVELINFCGTLGEPATNKELHHIFKYIHDHSELTRIRMHTNGSIQNEAWWKDIALSMKVDDELVFSIDGLKDTNPLYRKGTDFDKIIKNAKSFRENFSGQLIWEYLVFEHNEHQIEEAKKLADKIGFDQFIPKKSIGFYNEHLNTINPIPVRDKKGLLENLIHPPKNKDFLEDHLKNLEYNKKKWDVFFRKFDFNIAFRDYEPNLHLPNEKFIEVNCLSKVRNWFYMDVFGNVWPCCFIGGLYNGPNDLRDSNRIKDMIKNGKGVFNFKNKNSTTWFFKELERSKFQALKTCQDTCGKCL